MSLPQRKRREAVLQWLYSSSVQKISEPEMFSLMMEELKVTKKNLFEIYEDVKKIILSSDVLDEHIQAVSPSYKISQMQWIDLSILRLGTYEFIHHKEIPHPVVIAEAIRLAKKFSHPQAVPFINAVLDQVHNRLAGQSPDRVSIESAWKNLEHAQEEGKRIYESQEFEPGSHEEVGDRD